VETNAAGVETFALPDPEAIEESSIDALPHSQPKISPAYDASTMVRVGESGNIQNAAQESGFTIGDAPDGLTEAEREEKKKQDEEFHEALSGALEEQKERQERERQEAHAKEWDSKLHSIGNLKMTGAEWQSYFRWLQDPTNQQAVRDKLKKDGKSDDWVSEQERKTRELERYMELERLGKLTEEQKIQFQKLKIQLENDPDFQTYSQTASMLQKQGKQLTQSLSNEDKTSSEQSSLAVKTEDSVSAGADLLSGMQNDGPPHIREPFNVAGQKPEPDSPVKEMSNVIHLSEKFESANAAKTPLDQPSATKVFNKTEPPRQASIATSGLDFS
jgi:hypothetical protein